FLLGSGTQRLEEVITQRFPKARILRMDLDTARARHSHLEMWEKLERDEVDLLLGTQMIAKGLHLERVTLVGVLLADMSLYLPDFRAAERTFSLLTQVSGRAGRGLVAGEVIVQTYIPDHYILKFAQRQDYHAFAEEELRRRKILRFPPYQRLISILFSGASQALTPKLAHRLGDWLKEACRRPEFSKVSIVGPAPSPITRLRDRWRWRLLIRGAERRPARELLLLAREEWEKFPGHSQVQLTLDADPLDLL
ncbi:MAG: primosomal protein N', partial [bacterium]